MIMSEEEATFLWKGIATDYMFVLILSSQSILLTPVK